MLREEIDELRYEMQESKRKVETLWRENLEDAGDIGHLMRAVKALAAEPGSPHAGAAEALRHLSNI